jgi:broad specificity phosphatase PhoE
MIYVVRHGQDEDNAKGILNGHRNSSLTAKGISQARVAAKKLCSKKIDCIHVSPAIRARQTAEIIAELAGIDELMIEPDLIERDFGILTGKSIDEIRKYSQHVVRGDQIDYFLDGPGVETFPELMMRARRALEAIERDCTNQKIVVVTHGAIGKMMEAVWYNWTWQKSLASSFFDNAEIIELK